MNYFENFEKVTKRKTDNPIAEEVQNKRYQLFKKILPASSFGSLALMLILLTLNYS